MTANIQNEQGTKTCRRKLNQFGDYDDVTNMTPEDWDYRWAKQHTKFHMPQVHPMLKKHIDTLTKGNIKSRIFVPLCGKSLDMKWLADQGHEVVGNECADEGCRQFFEEHDLPYTTTPLQGIKGVLYKGSTVPIEIYRCDCFDLTSSITGKFECIWDRGGFVAIPVKDRKRYANILRNLMSPNCRYVLDAFLVDNDVFGGPPFNCTESDVKNAFASSCKVKKIDEKDVFGKWQESWGIDSFIEEVHLIEPL